MMYIFIWITFIREFMIIIIVYMVSVVDGFMEVYLLQRGGLVMFVFVFLCVLLRSFRL